MLASADAEKELLLAKVRETESKRMDLSHQAHSGTMALLAMATVDTDDLQRDKRQLLLGAHSWDLVLLRPRTHSEYEAL